MPRAVIDFNDTTKFPLKSLEGAFVELRRMSYGHKLQRQQLAMQMSVKGNGKNAEMDLKNETVKVAVFELNACVVDHNLEDEKGTKLNLGKMEDVVRLDPRVGEEIDKYISDMNNFEETDEVKN
jgi:hypothetical protein